MSTLPELRALIRGLCPVLTLLFCGVGSTSLADSPRDRESFDFGWQFSPGEAAGAEQPGYDSSTWRKLNLPHDWSIESAFDENAPTGGPGGYLPAGIGWYRKTFVLSPTMQGRVISVEFDGVYQNSDVWLNGVLLGHRPYGYASFAYDLTPHLRPGTNVLAVRVDNSRQPNSRWYSGSGIYRHVWLTATNPLHVSQWGTCVTTPAITPDAATVNVRATVRNETKTEVNVRLTNEIIAPDGRTVASATSEVPAAPGEKEFTQAISLPTPRLWSPLHPDLYRVRTTVARNETILDHYETTFGVRTIAYDVDRGFLLNGQPVKLLGMCVHHDGGAVGAAVPEAVLERRLRLLQAMGCNAIRCSHNPMAPEFYDLCDRLGLLVMDEAFDEWTLRKPQIKFGYSDVFKEWAERDLTDMIRRDRNHPSIVLWSAGNEISEQLAPEGPSILRKLVETFHREDPTRPVTAALDCIFTDQGPAPAEFVNLLDIAGYNYVDRWLDRRETFFGPDRSTFPGRKFVGTEDAGAGGVRGSYPFRAMPAGTPERAMYASMTIRVEQLWKFALTHDYVSGHFMWTGIDYLGEARWPRKSAPSGALDTCGFPKDLYYLYQSIFTTKPMLHLLPHWNWAGREGKMIPVLAYTNCDVVELTLNGRSLGAKAREFPRQGTQGSWNNYAKPQVFPSTADLHLSWDVPYEPGVLKAIGWKDGQKVCEAEVQTAGTPAAIALEIDRENLRADARDVAHLTVRIVDANGRVVPGAESEVKFEVQGSGALIGVDNGNPESHESFKATSRKAFGGLCLALIQAGTTPGEIRITATSPGLKAASITLHAQPTEAPPSKILLSSSLP